MCAGFRVLGFRVRGPFRLTRVGGLGFRVYDFGFRMAVRTAEAMKGLRESVPQAKSGTRVENIYGNTL